MSGDDGNPLEIDRIIHEPARLKIMVQLYALDEADFIFLMRHTGLTWGNLSSHMSKLEDASYLEVTKTFIGKKPHTVLKLTKEGRTAFERYRLAIDQVLKDLPK